MVLNKRQSKFSRGWSRRGDESFVSKITKKVPSSRAVMKCGSTLLGEEGEDLERATEIVLASKQQE